MVAEYLRTLECDVVVTFGAGNIDLHCDEIAAVLRGE